MKHLSVAVAATAILLATTACGGSPGTAAATDQLPAGGASADQQQGLGGFPGANGEIAAITGKTLQVQNPMEGQVAVTYTGSTKFTAEVAAAAKDLKVGSCVMVQGEGTDTVAATAVRITQAVAGSCTPRLAGGPRLQQGGENPPTDLPSNAPRAATMMGVFGKVSSVSSTGFTVETTVPGQTSTTTRQVTTSAKTTWSHTVAATSAALEVGRCVAAQGDKDATGSITAKTIAVSDKVGGQCTTGGVRRLAGGPPGGQP
jgi:hypothetical protein